MVTGDYYTFSTRSDGHLMWVDTGRLEGGQSRAGAIGQAGQVSQVPGISVKIEALSSCSILVTWSKQVSCGGRPGTRTGWQLATKLPWSARWPQGKVARQWALGGVEVRRWGKGEENVELLLIKDLLVTVTCGTLLSKKSWGWQASSAFGDIRPIFSWK